MIPYKTLSMCYEEAKEEVKEECLFCTGAKYEDEICPICKDKICSGEIHREQLAHITKRVAL